MTKAKTAIQKGKDLENYIADQIKSKGLDKKAYRSHGSGSGIREKADIWTSVTVFDRNLGIESKNQKTLHISEWWKQTKKLEKLNREPVLAFKIHGEPLEETKIVIYLDTFLDLIVEHYKVIGNSELLEDNHNEINHWDKVDIYNKLKMAKQTIQDQLNRYEKKILKEE